MQLFYVTYGFGYVQRFNYSVIKAEDIDMARRLVDEATNGRYAFIYTAKEFEGQPEKYGLSEIVIQPQTPR